MMHDHHLQETPGALNMWDPWLLLMLIIVGAVYFWLVGPGRHRFADAEPVKGWRKAVFVAGLVLWFIVRGTPVYYYGHHYLFSVHMLEMSVIYLMVPPMLLLGLPSWLLRPLMKNRIGRGVLKFVSRPLISVFLFNMMFSLYHMPAVFDWLHHRTFLHSGYHVLLFATAIQMWWPVVAPLRELDGMSYLRKVGYIFADGVLITPACALIIFAQAPMYESYAMAPQVFDWLPRLDDQQLGGVIMKLMQEFIYGTALLYLLYKWYKKESAPDQPDTLIRTGSWDSSNQQPNRA